MMMMESKRMMRMRGPTGWLTNDDDDDSMIVMMMALAFCDNVGYELVMLIAMMSNSSCERAGCYEFGLHVTSWPRSQATTGKPFLALATKILRVQSVE